MSEMQELEVEHKGVKYKVKEISFWDYDPSDEEMKKLSARDKLKRLIKLCLVEPNFVMPEEKDDFISGLSMALGNKLIAAINKVNGWEEDEDFTTSKV